MIKFEPAVAMERPLPESDYRTPKHPREAPEGSRLRNCLTRVERMERLCREKDMAIRPALARERELNAQIARSSWGETTPAAYAELKAELELCERFLAKERKEHDHLLNDRDVAKANAADEQSQYFAAIEEVNDPYRSGDDKEIARRKIEEFLIPGR